MNEDLKVIVKNSFLTIEKPKRMPLRSKTFDTGSLLDTSMMAAHEYGISDDSRYPSDTLTEDTKSESSLRWSDVDPLDDYEASEVEVMVGALSNGLDIREHEHDCGECDPCVFNKKSGGCDHGEDCSHCHFTHSEKYFKFTQKRNRAKRMAAKHGDQSRFPWTWQQFLDIQQ